MGGFSPQLKIFFLTMYLIIFLIGLIGSASILTLIATKKKMQTVTNIFIGLLATGDLLVVLFCLPFTAPSVYITEKWTLGLPACRFVLVMQTASMYISALTLTAMSVERYLVLVHPMKALTMWTKKAALYVSLAIIIASYLFSVPLTFMDELAPSSMITDRNDTADDYLCVVIGPKSSLLPYTLFKAAVTYVIPMVCMSVLYGLTIRQLKAIKINHGLSKKTLDSRRSVVNMLIAMVVILGLCWLPATAYNIYLAIDPESMFSGDKIMVLLPLVAFLIYVNCIMNPFLYSFMSSQYRRGFKRLFLKCLGCFCLRQRSLPLATISSSDTGKGTQEVRFSSNLAS